MNSPKQSSDQLVTVSLDEYVRSSAAAQMKRREEMWDCVVSMNYRRAVDGSGMVKEKIKGTPITLPDGSEGVSYSLQNLKDHGDNAKSTMSKSTKPLIAGRAPPTLGSLFESAKTIPQFDGSRSPRSSQEPHAFSPPRRSSRKRAAGSPVSPSPNVLVSATPKRPQKKARSTYKSTTSPAIATGSPDVIKDSFTAKSPTAESAAFSTAATYAALLDDGSDSPLSSAPDSTEDEHVQDDEDLEEVEEQEAEETDEEDQDSNGDNGNEGNDDDEEGYHSENGSHWDGHISEPDWTIEVDRYLTRVCREARNENAALELDTMTLAEKTQMIGNMQISAPQFVVDSHMSAFSYITGHPQTDEGRIFEVVYGLKTFQFCGRILDLYLYDTNHHAAGKPVSGVDSEADADFIIRYQDAMVHIGRLHRGSGRPMTPADRLTLRSTEEDLRDAWTGYYSAVDRQRGKVDVRIWFVMARGAPEELPITDPPHEAPFTNLTREELVDIEGELND